MLQLPNILGDSKLMDLIASTLLDVRRFLQDEILKVPIFCVFYVSKLAFCEPVIMFLKPHSIRKPFFSAFFPFDFVTVDSQRGIT